MTARPEQAIVKGEQASRKALLVLHTLLLPHDKARQWRAFAFLTIHTEQ
jgi:hypothetical protein